MAQTTAVWSWPELCSRTMADPACSGSGFQHEANERVGGAAAPAGPNKPEAGTVKQVQHIVDTAAYETDSRGRAAVRAVVLESQRGDVQRVRPGATHEISPPEETSCTRHSRRLSCDGPA